MLTPADALGASRLYISGIAAALHVATARATLELFSPSGRLLLVMTANRLEPPGVCGVWTTAMAPRQWALVAVGTVEQDRPLPAIQFTYRRRQVPAWLTRLGPFWLAEAPGRRLRVHVDDGRVATTARSRLRPGPISTRQSSSRLSSPFLPAQETS
jgi:hypothetical protein